MSRTEKAARMEAVLLEAGRTIHVETKLQLLEEALALAKELDEVPALRLVK